MNYDSQVSGFVSTFNTQDDRPGTSTTDVASVLPRTARAREQSESYSEDVWEMYKPRIQQLYIEDNKKLHEVMQQMKEERDFKPS